MDEKAVQGTGELGDADRSRVVDQLHVWRKQLINLARSNRLLYFRATRRSTLEIVGSPESFASVVAQLRAGNSWRFYTPPPDDAAGGDEADAFEEVAAGKGLPVRGHEAAPVRGPARGELATSKKTASELLSTLRTLDRRSTQEFMDKGIWILYLAAGFLHWTDPGSQEQADSPLVLVPVRLARENPREPYELVLADDDVVLNPALTVKLAEFGMELPGFDEDDLDLTAVLDSFEQAVSVQNGWKVERRLVISPFSFHKEVMYRDLDHNEALVVGHKLVQALAIGATKGATLDFDVVPEERLDEQVPPEATATILDADSSQMQCIAAAAAGHSFVIDGPPGSGKSQTITNIIAELLANGKTVLFVSEKAAALEVVHKRLRAKGLGDYCLQLHSQKATRKEVAQALGRALALHPTVPPGMPDTDVAQLRRRRQELSERALAMNEVRRPLGRSLYQVIGRICQLQGLPQAPLPSELGSSLSAEELTAILSVAGDLSRSWGPVARGEDFAWRDLADEVLDAARAQRTRAQLEAASSALDRLVCSLAENSEALLLHTPSDFQGAEALTRVLRQLESRPAGIHPPWLSCRDLDQVETLVQSRRKAALAHARAEKSLLGLVGSCWREVSESWNERVAAASARLRLLQPGFEAPPWLQVRQLEPLLDFLDATRTVAEDAKRDSGAIATAFGLPATGVTLRRAAELAELALLAGSQARPEPTWLNPALISTIEEAARVLQQLCTAFNERREQLGNVFTDDVLSLDLQGLCQRFRHVHRGMGKMRRTYRGDKRAIARVARSGKATAAVISQLPVALEWQRLTNDLKAAEARQANLLGTHYYHSVATDFAAIDKALECARRAIMIAGEHLNTEAMRRQLARGGDPDPGLVPIGARLKGSIDSWRAKSAALLGPLTDLLFALDLDVVTAWCVAASGPVSDLVEVGSAVVGVAGRQLNLGELSECLRARAEVAAVEEELARNEKDDKQKLGPNYWLLDTNWDTLDSSLDWAAKLRQVVGGQATTASAERLSTVELDWHELNTALGDWRRARDAIANNFSDERAAVVRGDLTTTFEDARSLLSHLASTTADIDEWVEFQRARAALVGLGVASAVEFCEAQRVTASQVPQVIERACLERWADVVIEEDRGRLHQLRCDQLDALVDEFRALDRKLVERASRRVIEACNGRRPRTTVGAAGIIKREAEKLRRHMPVRKLFEQAGEVAQRLKPCFMMSPLTVSQFIPPSLRFDAVIFDEASQVRPCDAINCIYRGKQVVIAGDDKQLPPSSFFDAASVDGDDDYEDDQFEDFESVIKLAKGSGGLRELPLRWHYRSQHEDLIAYSNFAFYEGRLVTFPGSTAEAGDLGVKFFHVPDGVYRRGTARDNPREAELVVDRVVHWARHSLDNPASAVTLGVVAFSEPQAEAIELALDRRRQQLPELDAFFSDDRLDGFFVKSLENVQGDERDVIVFSVGYGRDEAGKLTMNFGPLNRAGGERRLNVAITRARRRVELVASITGTEQEFTANLSDGPRHLQRYLDYAARGPVALAIDIGEERRDAESPLEEEVMRTVRAWGYRVKPQVGTAGYRVDLGVWHPLTAGRFALGIECDGAMYHSSRVARDRDRLRQEVLEGLGWRIYRVWGTSWYRHRREQEERLKAAIEAAIEDVEGAVAQATRSSKPAQKAYPSDFEPVPLDGAPSWTVPYQLATPRPPAYWGEMHMLEALPDLKRMILEVVKVEGPIEDELLLRRVREAWGVGRAGSRIRDNFHLALEALLRSRYVQRLERTFTFAHPGQLGVVRVPKDQGGVIRSIAQVSRQERATAVKRLVEDAHRVSRDELTFQICRLFGWNRRGSDIAVALEETIEELVRQEALLEEDGFLKLP